MRFRGDVLALGACLVQRNMIPETPGAFRSHTRAAQVEPGWAWFTGHRVDELIQGLRDESGLQLIDDECPDLVRAPSDWRERTSDEDRQRREAHAYVDSGDPARRAAGASTLARLELADRGPWVEEAVVAWEIHEGAGADLAFAGLCVHELRWLRLAHDKLAPRLLAFLWWLASDNANLLPIARRVGAKPDVFDDPKSVPNEMAAAAAGIRRRSRSQWLGPARLLHRADHTRDPKQQASLLLRAGMGLMQRYGSGWRPERVEDAVAVIGRAVQLLDANDMPKSRALALAHCAEAEDALGHADRAEFLRAEALDLLDDGYGGYLDQSLGEALVAKLA